MVTMICVTVLEHGIKGFKCIIGCAHTRFEGEHFPVGEIDPRKMERKKEWKN